MNFLCLLKLPMIMDFHVKMTIIKKHTVEQKKCTLLTENRYRIHVKDTRQENILINITLQKYKYKSRFICIYK